MNLVITEAKKTLYRNIEFKSKSEAIFCRALDLAGGDEHNLNRIFHTFYEPFTINNSNYKPDFIVSTTENLVLIEYKPKYPNELYIQNLKKLLLKNQQQLAMFHAFIIVSGSPFNDDRWSMNPILQDKSFKYEEMLENLSYAVSKINEAKKYRFDLEQDYKKESYTFKRCNDNNLLYRKIVGSFIKQPELALSNDIYPSMIEYISSRIGNNLLEEIYNTISINENLNTARILNTYRGDYFEGQIIDYLTDEALICASNSTELTKVINNILENLMEQELCELIDKDKNYGLGLDEKKLFGILARKQQFH